MRGLCTKEAVADGVTASQWSRAYKDTGGFRGVRNWSPNARFWQVGLHIKMSTRELLLLRYWAYYPMSSTVDASQE